MQIFCSFDQFNVKTFTVKVQKSDSVGTLKEKIADKCNILVARMRLRCNSKCLLEDDKTLYDYNVQDNCTVRVGMTNYGRKAAIKTTGGKTIDTNLFASEIWEIKDYIHHLEGIPPDQQHLFFEEDDIIRLVSARYDQLIDAVQKGDLAEFNRLRIQADVNDLYKVIYITQLT